jgi:hypothetical protein
MFLADLRQTIQQDFTRISLRGNVLAKPFKVMIKCKIFRQTDVLIGGLYETPVSRQLLSSTTPYFSDDLTFCVAQSGFRPTWLNVFAIFKYYIWMATLLTILISSYVLFIFTRVEAERHDNYLFALLITLSLTMGITGNYSPRRSITKIFMVSVIFFGIIFSASYQSFLLSVLTNPRRATQVSTVEMAIDEGYTFTGPDNIREFFESGGDIKDYLKEFYENCDDIDECLYQVKYHKKLAVALSRQHALNSPSPITEDDMYCFAKVNNIYTFSVVMLVMKDYFLLPKMNLMFRRMSETGFMLKWQQDAELIKIAAKSKMERETRRGNERVKLNIDHLTGAFYILFCGLILSTLGFIFEWIIYFLIRKTDLKFRPVVMWIEKNTLLNF